MENIDKCLIINDGKTALKFSLFSDSTGKKIVSGKCINIGHKNSIIKLRTVKKEFQKSIYMNGYEEAIVVILNALLKCGCIHRVDDIKEIGNRVINGGRDYKESVFLDEDVLDYLRKNYPSKTSLFLALKKYMPEAVQTVSFDTSFYKNNDKEVLPEKVLSAGFHGISYDYITSKMQSFFNKKDVNLIACHLGNASSICAIKNGKPLIATMTDVTLSNYVLTEENANAGSINAQDILSKYKRYIGSVISHFYNDLNGQVDAIIFTGGIGENSSKLRKDIINSLPMSMNVYLKNEVNENVGEGKETRCGVITDSDSSILVLVLPSNEDLVVLRDIKSLKNKDRVKQLTK